MFLALRAAETRRQRRTGITQSTDFSQNDTTFTPGSGFVAELSANGGSLLYSGRYPNGSTGQDIAVDASGSALLLGSSASLTKLDLGAATTAAVVGVANTFGGAITNLVAPGELVSMYGSAIGGSRAACRCVAAHSRAARRGRRDRRAADHPRAPVQRQRN
jgi:hypothetical protein